VSKKANPNKVARVSCDSTVIGVSLTTVRYFLPVMKVTDIGDTLFACKTTHKLAWASPDREPKTRLVISSSVASGSNPYGMYEEEDTHTLAETASAEAIMNPLMTKLRLMLI
jgi:hypothetical protein